MRLTAEQMDIAEEMSKLEERWGEITQTEAQSASKLKTKFSWSVGPKQTVEHKCNWSLRKKRDCKNKWKKKIG